MASSKNRVLWDFFANTKPLEKGLKRVQGGFKDTEKSSSSIQTAFGGVRKAIGALGLAFGANELLQWGRDAAQMAIAAEEVESKFQAVFGAAQEFRDNLNALGDMAGITETDMNSLAATFGNLAMSVGMPEDATKDLTLSVATLAADMASFNDSDPAEVFNTLNTAVLTAERDGLKKYGISVSENEVKTKALEIATADGRKEITKADKAMASYALITARAGKANGDLERTQDSLANRQRRLTASMEEMKEAFGRELIDSIDRSTKALDGNEDAMKSLGSTAGKVAAGMSSKLVDAFVDVARAADQSEDAGSRWRSAYEAGLDVTTQFSFMLRGFRALVEQGGKATRDAALEMEEYKKGIEATTRAISDASGVAVPYLEHLALMRNGISTTADQIGASAGDIETELTDFDDMLKIFSGAMFERAAEVRRAAAEHAAAVALFAGGGGAGGGEANPVYDSQVQNDLRDIGSQVGG